jgi:hypothetical protein
VHVQQRVSGDGTGVHEQRRQVRVMQHRVLSERYRVYSVHVHVQQRVSGDGTGMHEQRRQVRIVQRRVLSERYRVCEKGLHVLQRNRRRGDRLPNAQYRQVRVVQPRVLPQRKSMRSVHAFGQLPRDDELLDRTDYLSNMR